MRLSVRTAFLVATVLAQRWIGVDAAASASSDDTPGKELYALAVGCTLPSSSTPPLAYPTLAVDPLAVSSNMEPQLAFSKVIPAPSIAKFMSLHFSQFNLPASDYLLIRPSDRNSSDKLSFKYHGGQRNGAFFSTALRTTSVTLELYTLPTAAPALGSNVFACVGFTIDSFHYLADPAMGSAREEVCGADNSEEASCSKSTAMDRFTTSEAVARLLIHKGDKSFFCTGWLVGSEGHLLTNNHCISTQDHASNTEFEFVARGDACSTACNTPLGCPGKVRTRSSTLVYASAALDYALVKLDINLSGEYGALQMREAGALLNERVYVPQHPGGWGRRIAMKVDGGGWGKVESVTQPGCLDNQVAYSLDTQGGSSGSPVIAWDDNAVVAIHHCGGCPNTAVNMNQIVADMRARNILPANAVYTPQAWKPAPTPSPVPAPTPAPTLPPTLPPTNAPTNPPVVTTTAPTPTPTPLPTPTAASPKPVQATKVDGTITTTATIASIDYVDFELAESAVVELDILSMETRKEADDVASRTYVDVNGDCNAGHIDASIVLFKLSADGSVAESSTLAINDDAPAGYGTSDGSISSADSYILRPLDAGRYRVAVGVSSMTVAQAVAKSMPVATSPRVCDAQISNYGSYRLTIATTSAVTVVGPDSYIGSQCSGDNSLTPYSACPYHTEAALANVVPVDGTIVRQGGAVSVDYIPFTVPSFGRVTIDVTSFESRDGHSYIDVNGFCASGYIDAVAYLFRQPAGGSGGGAAASSLSLADVVNVGDDDDNFPLRKRAGVSFRDPFLSLGLPPSSYVLVVGRYPMTVQAAIDKANTNAPELFTPESCGAATAKGNYRVSIASARDLSVVSPNSFVGAKCPTNAGNALC